MYYVFLILGLVFSQYCQNSCNNCRYINYTPNYDNMLCNKCVDKYYARDCCTKTLYPTSSWQSFSCKYALQLQAERMLYILSDIVNNNCQQNIGFEIYTDNGYTLAQKYDNTSMTTVVSTGGHAYIYVRYLVQKCPVTIVTSYIML